MVPKEKSKVMELVLLQKVTGVKGCIQLYEFIEDEFTKFYIMERPEECCDLFDLVNSQYGLSEEDARKYFRQIVIATQACHEAGVLHRDLKEDFGQGVLLRDDPYVESFGTDVYVPPEWVAYHHYHGVPATVWSLGVLLFSMLCNVVPFFTDMDICRGEVRFTTSVTADCEHLIRSMLSMDPERRPDLDAILKHKWMQTNICNV